MTKKRPPQVAASGGPKKENKYAREQYAAPTGLSNQHPPRLRAVIEFIEGDVNRPPIVFPDAGGEEADARLRQEILKRWSEK